MPSLKFLMAVRYIVELHILIADGDGDLPVADEIRDRMDLMWEGKQALTMAQKELIRQISADLYEIIERR